MISFLVGRLAQGALVLWALSVAVFALFFVAPGGGPGRGGPGGGDRASAVARSLAGRQASEETVAAVVRRLGLDDPLPEQYLRFLTGVARGDLGHSFRNDEPVTAIIAQRLPVTASLVLGAAVLWLAVGVAAGAFAARRPRSPRDRATAGIALLFHSTPTFLLGQVLLFALFYRLGLAGVSVFPPGGYAPLGDGPFEWARHLALPWLALALVQAATYARLTRGAMVEALAEDYVRTARAKGVTERRVTLVHGLRAAATPVASQLGVDLGALLGGVVVIEAVFGLSGLGKLAVDAVLRQDRPVIIGVVLVGAAFVVSANLIVDALYALLDPRLRTHP